MCKGVRQGYVLWRSHDLRISQDWISLDTLPWPCLCVNCARVAGSGHSSRSNNSPQDCHFITRSLESRDEGTWQSNGLTTSSPLLRSNSSIKVNFSIAVNLQVHIEVEANLIWSLWSSDYGQIQGIIHWKYPESLWPLKALVAFNIQVLKGLRLRFNNYNLRIYIYIYIYG